MNRKIITWPLAYNFKIVDKRKLLSGTDNRSVASATSSLVQISGCQPSSLQTLRLSMERKHGASCLVVHLMKDNMQSAFQCYYFSLAIVCTRYKCFKAEWESDGNGAVLSCKLIITYEEQENGNKKRKYLIFHLG